MQDGTVFEGVSFGAAVSTAGEVVFQTGMVRPAPHDSSVGLCPDDPSRDTPESARQKEVGKGPSAGGFTAPT